MPTASDTPKRRLQQQEPQCGRQRDRLNQLPSPAAMRGRFVEEERHVRTNLRRQRRESFDRQRRSEMAVQPEQHCRSIAAAATETGAVRNALLQLDRESRVDRPPLRGTDAPPARRDCRRLSATLGSSQTKSIPLRVARRDRDHIEQRHRRHQRLDFVKAIRAPAKNPEGKIDLRGRTKLHRFHSRHQPRTIQDELGTDCQKRARSIDHRARFSRPRTRRSQRRASSRGEVRFFKIGLQLYTAAGSGDRARGAARPAQKCSST